MTYIRFVSDHLEDLTPAVSGAELYLRRAGIALEPETVIWVCGYAAAGVAHCEWRLDRHQIETLQRGWSAAGIGDVAAVSSLTVAALARLDERLNRSLTAAEISEAVERHPQLWGLSDDRRERIAV